MNAFKLYDMYASSTLALFITHKLPPKNRANYFSEAFIQIAVIIENRKLYRN